MMISYCLLIYIRLSPTTDGGLANPPVNLIKKLTINAPGQIDATHFIRLS